MERYYQEEIECAPYEKIREIQSEKLVKQVKHVWDNVPYYRKKMEEKGVTPEDIKSVDDLKGAEDLTLRRINDRILAMCTPVFVGGSSKREKTAEDNYRSLKGIFEDKGGENHES